MSEIKKIPTSFAVSIYGKIEPYQLNPMMSKARVKTFYKYMNRNGGYFSDSMTQYIVEHAAGTPVVGHFDVEKVDFTSHMRASESKAYGFIPPHNTNFAWESFTDPDGVRRDYACFDVLLWTGRYGEAKLIPGKSQSMELNPDTITGNWKYFENEKTEAFEYTHCDLVGLCVLGDEVEPCFEGAAFYTPNGQFNLYLSAMKEEIVKNFALQVNNLEGGRKKMPIKFNLPHEDNFETLFNLMNPKFNEENEFLVEYMIHTVSEKELYAYSYADKKNYLVAYNTNEEGVVSLGEPQELGAVFGLTVEAANAQHELVGEGTIEDVQQKIKDYEMKIEELTAAVASKDEEIAEFTKVDFQANIDGLNKEIEGLKSQLHNYEVERAAAVEAEKEKLINEYANLLDAEDLNKYKTEKVNFSLEELEGKLAVQFARKYRGKSEDVRLPGNNQESAKSPTVRALEAYKQKKGE